MIGQGKINISFALLLRMNNLECMVNKFLNYITPNFFVPGRSAIIKVLGALINIYYILHDYLILLDRTRFLSTNLF